MDDRVRPDIRFNAFSLHPTVHQYMVEQVELYLAGHRHCVDSLGVVNLDFSMLACEALLGSLGSGSLY